MRRLTLLLALETAAVLTLALAQRVVVPDSVRAATPSEVMTFGLWVGALAVAGWLLASTLALCAVEVLPAVPPRLHRAVAGCAPRVIRVLVTRTVAFSVLASITATPAVAATDEDMPGVRTGRETNPTPEVTPDPQPAVPEPVATEPTPTPIGGRRFAEHRVEPGDNLWSIAADHLRAHGAGEPSDPEIARYWITVIDHNRPTLRSGDPDLIYPGEIVTLPQL
jgi:hypothetical protein